MIKRKDGQFGLHFDMHAQNYTKGIGSDFDSKVIEDICTTIKPDYIQVDTKGHPGYSSYPTLVGLQAPEIKKDILKIWREVTKKHGILLIAHHSGIIDGAQVKLHPEWAIVDENGNVSDERTSIFSDYSKKVLIPQLIELATTYGLDGAWIDGDCAGVKEDYSENAKIAYGKRIPKIGKRGYRKYQDFLRKEFTKYVKNYITEVKNVAPNFEITSNWFNSPNVPEEASVTDYLSGDLCPVSSIIYSRFYGRMLASFKRDWDIMSWGFSLPVYYVKPTAQICQEAASILMLGGGFQVYNLQNPNGTLLNDWIIPHLKNIADFCRERKFCHRSRSIAEVGVLYSKQAAYYKKNAILGSMGSFYNNDIRDLISALLDNQLSVKVLLQSDKNLEKLSMIVLPNSGALEKGIKNRLLKYVVNGGTVVLTGTNSLELFKSELKIKEISVCNDNPAILFRTNNLRNVVTKNYAKIEGSFIVKSVMNVLEKEADLPNLNKKIIGEEIPSVIESSYGNGKFVAVTFDYGLAYGTERTSELRNLLKEITDTVTKKLTVKGSKYVEVDLQEKANKTYIHLLNVAGEHRAFEVKTFDEIPALFNLEVEYKCEKTPRKVIVLPENNELNYTYDNGVLKTKIANLNIHSAIEITY